MTINLLNSVSQKTTFSARLVWLSSLLLYSANLTSGTQQVYLHELWLDNVLTFYMRDK